MKPTALYRHYDKDDNLLYIGISLSSIGRYQTHRNQSHWAKYSVKMTTEWFDTRKLAEDAEKKAITQERPLHNIIYNSGRDIVDIVESDVSVIQKPLKIVKSTVYPSTTYEFVIPEGQLLELLKRTYFCMGGCGSSSCHNVMLLELDKNHIRTVCTDGHRISMYSQYINLEDIDDVQQSIISKKDIENIFKFLDCDSSTPLNVTIDGQYFKVKSFGFEISTLLVQNDYPNYIDNFSNYDFNEVTLERSNLKRVLCKIKTLCEKDFHGVKISANDGVLSLSPNGEETTDGLGWVFRMCSTKTSFLVGLNISYFLDCLGSFTNEFVTLNVGCDERGVIITDPDDIQMVNVIMPIRLW